MKVLVEILALVAVVSAKSIPALSQSHAIAPTSAGSSPIVSIEVNINKAVPNPVDIQGLPDVSQVAPTPVAVIDGPGFGPGPVSPVIVAPEIPAPVLLPEPALPEVVAPPEPEISLVLPEPAFPENISPVEPNSPVIVVPGPVISVPAPVVLPEPALPEVVAPEVRPEMVLPGIVPETNGSSGVTNNFFVKIFNFYVSDGSDFSTLPQGLGSTIFGSPKPFVTKH